jgi:hypothetical protein
MPGIAGPPLSPEQQWWQDHNVLPPGTPAGVAGMMVNIPPYPGPPPPSDTGTPPAPTAQGGAGAASSGQATMPSGGEDIQSPAVQALSGIANPDSFRQQINPEGWSMEAPPQLAVPGERNMPPSSRALSTLANQRGRVY